MSAGKVVFHSAIQPTKTTLAGATRNPWDPGLRQTWASRAPDGCLGDSSPSLSQETRQESVWVPDSCDQGERG